MSKASSQPGPGNSPTPAHSEPVPLVSDSDLINPRLKVADVMTASPRTCSPFSTVLEAVMIFRDADCGVVPVVEDGKPAGVLTDRDVALALSEFMDSLPSRNVGDLMSKDVVTVGVDDSLITAFERLGDERIRRLMVVDADGRLRGILSWVDLVPHLSERGLGRVASRIFEKR